MAKQSAADVHQCTVNMFSKSEGLLGKEKINRQMNKWIKATEGMSPEVKTKLSAQLVKALTDRGAITNDISYVIDFHQKALNDQRFQEGKLRLNDKATWTRADHVASVVSIADGIFQNKDGPSVKDIKTLGERLKGVTVEDIQEALGTSTSSKEFVDKLSAISPEMAKWVNENEIGYHRGFIEILEDLELNAKTSMVDALKMLEDVVTSSDDLMAIFSDDTKMRAVLVDLFDNEAQGKFITEMATGLYNKVFKPLAASANSVGQYIRKPLNTFFNMAVAAPHFVAAKTKDDFVAFVRKLIIDDAKKAVEEMGIPIDIEKFAAMPRDGTFYEKVLLERLGEIYTKLVEGDQYRHDTPHIDGTGADAFNEAAKNVVNPSWNASGGLSPLMVVPWKDAASFITYLQEFSSSTVGDIIHDKVMWMGKNVGIMERFGTHPEAMYNQLHTIAKDNALKAGDKRSHALLEGRWFDSFSDSFSKLDLDDDIAPREAELKVAREKALADFYLKGDDTALTKADKDYFDLIQEQVKRFEDGIESTRKRFKEETDPRLKEQARKEMESLKQKLGQYAQMTDKLGYAVKHSINFARDLYSGNPEHYFNTIIGKTGQPLDNTLNAFYSTAMSTTASTFLARAWLNSAPDIVNRAFVLSRYIKGGAFEKTGLFAQTAGNAVYGALFSSDGMLAGYYDVWTDVFPNLMKYLSAKYSGGTTPRISGINKSNYKRFDAKARREAARASYVFSDLINHTRERLHGVDDGIGVFWSKTIDAAMKGIGLQGMDSAGHMQTAMITNHFLTWAIETPWKEMDAELGVGTRKMFERHGIGADDLKKLEPYIQTVGGVPRLMVQDARSALGRDFSMKFARFSYDLARNATIVPGDKSKAMISQGTRAGTAQGALLRMMGMFTSFSHTMNNQFIPFMNRNNPAGPGHYGHLAGLTVAGMNMAMISGFFRQIAFREEQQEMNTQYFVDLFLRTGLASIYGELLLKEYDHYHTLSKSLTGPAFSVIDRLPALAQGDKKATAKQLKQLLPVLTGSPTITTIVAGDAIDSFLNASLGLE